MQILGKLLFHAASRRGWITQVILHDESLRGLQIDAKSFHF